MPTIGQEVVADGTDVNVGGGGGGGGGGSGVGDGNDDAHGSSVLLSSNSLPTGGGVPLAALSSSASLQDGMLWLSFMCALGEGEADVAFIVHLPRRTAQQLAWREGTIQQSTKPMEMMGAVKTRTANARVKARSGVCECVYCCCCCFHSSWDSRGQDVLIDHYPHCIAIFARLLTRKG